MGSEAGVWGWEWADLVGSGCYWWPCWSWVSLSLQSVAEIRDPDLEALIKLF